MTQLYSKELMYSDYMADALLQPHVIRKDQLLAVILCQVQLFKGSGHSCMGPALR